MHFTDCRRLYTTKCGDQRTIGRRTPLCHTFVYHHWKVHDGNFRIMLLQGLPIIDESIRKGLTQSETYTDLALIMDLVSVNKINSKYLRLAFEIMDTVNSKRTRKSFNSGFFRALRELAVWHASSGGFTDWCFHQTFLFIDRYLLVPRNSLGSHCSLTLIEWAHQQFSIVLQTRLDEAVTDIIDQVYPNE